MSVNRGGGLQPILLFKWEKDSECSGTDRNYAKYYVFGPDGFIKIYMGIHEKGSGDVPAVTLYTLYIYVSLKIIRNFIFCLCPQKKGLAVQPDTIRFFYAFPNIKLK